MAQEVEVKIKVSTDKAVNDINKLGDAFDSTAKDAKDAQNVFEKTNDSLDLEPSINNLKQLKKELKAATVGTKDFDRLSMSIRDMEDAIGDAKKSNDDFLGQMENAGGPLGMLGKGIRSAETATSSFSGALKATGIGLVVALIGGLVAAFSENEGAMKKIQPLIDGLKKAFQGVFRAVEPLFNTFVDLAAEALPYVTKGIGMVYSAMMAYFTFLKESGGGALKILKGIFTLDGDAISSGIDQIGGSFKKTTTAYTDSMKRFEAGSKELTEAEKEQLEKREEARKAAEEKRKVAEEKAKQKRIEDAKLEAERLQKELDAYNEFQNKIIAADLENSLKKRTQKEQDILDLEEAFAKEQAIETKAIEQAKIASDKKIEIAKAEAQQKIDIQNAQLALATSAVGFLKEIGGKNKAIQKASIIAENAIGIGKMIIANNAANIGALATPQAILSGGISAAPIIAMNNITTGLGIATTLASTAKALSAVGGGSAGGASGAGGGGGIPAPAPAQFNVVGASGANQIAQTLAGGQQQPVQAYVVAGAVTTGQSLNRNIINNASMG